MKNKSIIILVILLSLFVQGCLGSKKVSEKSKTTNTTEKTESKKDSTTHVETSGEIKDRIVINVPPADNEATEKSIEAILKMLNTSKSSGSNSYVSRYDEETRQLVIDFIVAQTQNKTTETNQETNSEKSFEEQTDEYISKKVTAIPWWIYVIVVFLFRKQIFGWIIELFPALKTVKWLVRLVT